MSVTFFMPQAPVEQYAPFDDEPEYLTSRPVAPFTELNVSNANAEALLSVVDPTGLWGYGLYGEWEGGKLHAVRTRIMVALNTSKGDALLAAPTVDGNVYCGGRDSTYVHDRLTTLLQIVVTAIEHGFKVVVA